MKKQSPHQPSLFGNEEVKINTDFLSNQLIKLGDMMGDGLHHEEPWIAREYSKIAKALHPEIYQDIRKKKSDNVNEQMKKLLLGKKCTICLNGVLAQSRKGSKKIKCLLCGARYTATSKK
jgi:hypothetical protein